MCLLITITSAFYINSSSTWPMPRKSQQTSSETPPGESEWNVPVTYVGKKERNLFM